MKFNILDIRRGTTVDGPGFRTSVYLAGCNHKCPGCHNPDSWNFDGGVEMTLDEILAIIEEEDFDVTLTGGDPLMQPEKVRYLTKAIKQRFNKNIWLYTGFTISQIRLSPELRKGVEYIDTIVEGPFKIALRNTDRQFRGSSNQRIIHLNHIP